MNRKIGSETDMHVFILSILQILVKFASEIRNQYEAF